MNEWDCLHLVLTLGLMIIVYWLLWLEMMALDLCHIVFDGVVFIAPLYWGVNDVL